MTKAIILSAGQGRRLLPLTEQSPKCLLKISGRTILEWQLDMLISAGIEEVRIITGFHAEKVDELLQNNYSTYDHIRTEYNPFYDISDNLASCWMARNNMDNDFLLINGDTVFELALLEHVINSPVSPITLTIDIKSEYDEDDMKVELDDEYVRHVSKSISTQHTHAESIGLLYFRNDGPQLFRNKLEEAMREPAGIKSWFLSVIDSLAGEKLVTACSISGFRWSEIDFINDLKTAESVFAETALSIPQSKISNA